MCTLTASPSNAFCRLQQRQLPEFPQQAQALRVSCWAPAHREQPQGPFSLSPDLGIQAGQAPKSGPVIEFVGVLLTWAPISFLRSANITNICSRPHRGRSDLYKTPTAFVHTFTKVHRVSGTAGWGIRWRQNKQKPAPLKKLKSQRSTGPTAKVTSGHRPKAAEGRSGQMATGRRAFQPEQYRSEL